MTRIVVTRPERGPVPEVPAGRLPVPAPPPAPRPAASGRPLVTVLPVLAGTVMTALVFAGSQGGRYGYAAAIAAVSSLGMLAASFGATSGRSRRAELALMRHRYLRSLAVVRRAARGVALAQRDASEHRHPAPEGLYCLVDSARLWERRPGDTDYGVVRVGTGPRELATALVVPDLAAATDPDPVMVAALHRFVAAHATVPDLPVTVRLPSFRRVSLCGDRTRVMSLARALLAQLTVLHAPGELLVVVCADPARRPDWEYVKWLPHAQHPTRTDALGPERMLASDRAGFEALLASLGPCPPRSGPDDRGPANGAPANGAPANGGPANGAPANGGRERDGPQRDRVDRRTPDVRAPDGHGPDVRAPDGSGPGTGYLVAIADGVDVTGATSRPAASGVTVLDLDPAGGPGPSRPDRLTLTIDPDGTLHRESAAPVPDRGGTGEAVADVFDMASAESLARQLAPLRLAPTGTGRCGDRDLAELLGIGDPYRYTARAGWRPRADRDVLRVPIGVRPDGVPVELDLKESARDGMGPHGLLVGATGSGKSELLRTLVLGLAATHDSGSLNFVLIDFKGGATFASLDRLPHAAAVITNLAADLTLVDRMAESLHGELVRRQEALRDAGNLASLRAYSVARDGGAPLPPLPALLVICDEFSELLDARPELVDLFVQIGRVGRSLGVHLLLASQRLEEGRLRGLDAQLSYRIGLRTFSALESRAVLGVPDAYRLPRSPGHGYLRYGVEPPVRFRAAYVSGPYRTGAHADHTGDRDTGDRDAGDRGGAPARVLRFTADPVPPGRAAGAAPAATTAAPHAVASATAAPHDPGPATASLLDLLVDRLAGAGTPAHPVWLPPLATPPGLDELLGPLGVVAGAGLTVADHRVRGGLRVPVGLVDHPYRQRREPLWLTLTGDGGHAAIVGGPQSGKSTLVRTLLCALALTHTPHQVQFYCLDLGGGQLATLRGLPHVGTVAGRHEQALVRRTVADLTGLLGRRERARVTGTGPYRWNDGYGQVFLVVDGWRGLQEEYGQLAAAIADLATRGLSYGIHLFATATRWMDFRPAVRDLFGSRLELRLGDPADSLVSGRVAAGVPVGSPGRGLTSQRLHFLAALPALTTVDLVPAVAAAWPGERAAPVRLLPGLVRYRRPEPGGRDHRLQVGIAEVDLAPAAVDFAADPHLLVFGDPGSGKSSFLRALATSICARYHPEQARVVLVDHGRGLVDLAGSEHVIGHGTGPQHTGDLIASVAGYLRRRLPGPDVTVAELRERAWWSGPDCYVLIDDYEKVAGDGDGPLSPLLEFLGQAGDVGLHVVLARRCAGASRALYEPVIRRLREMSTPGLLLSGDRDEGPLLAGVRPGPLPPGRAWLVRYSSAPVLVQLCYLAPS